jgi:hypothetical protein
MAETGKRKYALADFSVELRARGWYFGRPYDPANKYRGPYNSIASVTLMIARATASRGRAPRFSHHR